MRKIPLIALALTLLTMACPAPVTAPVDAGVIACAPLDAGCSDTQACCDGIACHAGQCACAAKEGAACGGANASCCPGMTCDPTGHCQAACAGAAGACAGPRDTCTSTADCCAPATCVKGQCEARGPRCSDDGEACTTASDCCGSTTLGTRPACVTVAGKSVCRFGRRDENCSPTQPCLAAFSCIVDAGVTPVVDAGTPSDAGADLDAGTDPDAGTPVADAGTPPVDAGTPTTVGTCGVVGNPPLCTLRSATCALGASCDPNSSANQGYDPCSLQYTGGSLYYRAAGYACHSGVCALPQLNDTCTGKCSETPGATNKTVCAELDVNSKVCAVSCTTDADCPGVFYPNGNLASAQRFGVISHAPLTQWCVPHPELGKSVCQPRLCFEDAPDRDNEGFLFKACADVPNSICLPHETSTLSDYFGSSGTSTVLGFCHAVRPGTAPTVGQACDERSGTEAPERLCGPDALCVGGRCQPLCDASQPGGYFPACGPSQTCLNPYYGTDPLSGHQTGMCGVACDPFADEAHSGCTNFCGGPRARCQWQGLDKVPGPAHCVAMAAHPKPAGAPCAATGECGTGMICWSTADDNSNPVCTQLCSQAAAAGSPDACRQGSCQPLYDGANRIGACL